MNEPPRFGPPFSAYQAEIFVRGIGGERPALPLRLDELARAAEAAIDPRAATYVFGGAGSADTERDNEAAFRRWRIVPRMPRDIADIEMASTVLGTAMPAPVALAPIGGQAIVHPDGELAAARAAAAVGLPMCVSTVSSFSMEEIAAASPGTKWLQLYWPPDRELGSSFLSRAESAGFSAIVLTLDVSIAGWRPGDLEIAWIPYLDGIGIANYLSDPVFRSRLLRPPEEDLPAAVGEFLARFGNPRLTWDEVDFIRAGTELPIALKGILHPDDARAAREHGIDAIVVSNHGGRQLDGVVASLDALPAIVDAVGDDLEVLFDSGVRTGADAVKALSLGARAVLLGRPYLWGLALAGEAGALAVLRSFLAELEITLGLSGHALLSQLHPGVLVREGAPG